MSLDGSSGSEEHLAYGADVEERPKSQMSGLSSRKSEPDFEKIDAESGAEDVGERRTTKRTVSSGSWMPWSWGAKGEESVDTVMAGTEHERHDVGKSSGVDA